MSLADAAAKRVLAEAERTRSDAFARESHARVSEADAALIRAALTQLQDEVRGLRTRIEHLEAEVALRTEQRDAAIVDRDRLAERVETLHAGFAEYHGFATSALRAAGRAPIPTPPAFTRTR